MKASALIDKLQNEIQEAGDFDVVVSGAYGNGFDNVRTVEICSIYIDLDDPKYDGKSDHKRMIYVGR